MEEKIKIMSNLSTIEVEELACKLTGLDYDEIDADEVQIADALTDQFGCDLEQFTKIISLLLPLIDVGESPMSKKRYKGFSDVESQMWFVKMEIPSKKKK